MRLSDLASFYTRENARNIDAFFTSELNNIYYKVEFVDVRGQLRLTFKRGGSTYEVHRADKLNFSWPR